MARIAGVDIPRNKRVEIALTYIYGIGKPTSQRVLTEAGVNFDTRVKDLTEEEVNKIRAIIETVKVEGDLRKDVRLSIKRLMDIKCYRGPMMVGYATSNLFFSQDEEQSRFSSFLLEDGTFMYLEGASLVNKKETKEGAKKFMEYVLSEDFQNLVPQKNYMFPVTEISLTEEFKFVPVAEKTVKLSDEQVKDLHSRNCIRS